LTSRVTRRNPNGHKLSKQDTNKVTGNEEITIIATSSGIISCNILKYLIYLGLVLVIGSHSHTRICNSAWTR